MTEWEGYYPEGYRIHFAPNKMVLDVGCGSGYQMKQLLEQGSSVIGLGPDLAALMECRSKGLAVLRAQAEQVPLKDSSLDGILCQVVLPYTHEEQSVFVGRYSQQTLPGISGLYFSNHRKATHKIL